MNVAVVVSTWSGSAPVHLMRLCNSLQRHPAAHKYDLILCVNDLNYILPDALTKRFLQVFVRDNAGYNLGAWDYAWRHLPDHDYFLFLQDDCIVSKNGWLQDFITCFVSTPRCGLVGENVERTWDKPWSELCSPSSQSDPQKNREVQQRAIWADFFREKLRDWNIPEGDTGRHITAVVQFISRTILEEVGGYNSGNTKAEATAAEVAFSRKIAARGYALVQVGRWRHSRIGHPQWPSNAPQARLWRSIKKRMPPFIRATSGDHRKVL